MVRLKNLIRDSIPVLRSAHDIVMTAGRNGRAPSDSHRPVDRDLAKSRLSAQPLWDRCSLQFEVSRSASDFFLTCVHDERMPCRGTCRG
eukprot:4554803-Pyramimonas_sp.AAC.1